MATPQEQLKDLFQQYQHQERTKAEAKISFAAQLLLDLFGCKVGKIRCAQAEDFSIADELRYYGQHNDDACAILHLMGWAAVLGNLPKPTPAALARWGRVMHNSAKARTRAASKRARAPRV